MPTATLLSIAAILAMLPAALAGLRSETPRPLFWLLLVAALAGPLAWIAVDFAPGWRTGLSSALWVSVAATLALFLGLAALSPAGRRLTVLLMPYLALLGGLATIWQHQPERPLIPGEAGSAWVAVHIVTALIAYALLTLGAVAALAVFLQERALKRKRPTALTSVLPAVADAERLQIRLLGASAAVLGLGLLTGTAARLVVEGRWLSLDHKTVLSVATLAVLLFLLIAHRRSGVRGRRAARLLLLAYLLLTLAYPGVKFVTDVLAA